MAGMLMTNAILLTALTCWQNVITAKIEITPVKFDGLITTAVNITCLPRNVENGIKKVVGITLVRGEQQMASLLRGSEVVYGNDLTTIIQADGLIDSNVSNSFLRVSMPQVLIRDSGKYTCYVYHVNAVGFLDMETISDNLVVEDQDIQTHLAYLIRKVFTQEDLIQDQARRLQNQTIHLQDIKHQFKNEGLASVDRIGHLEDVIQNKIKDIQEWMNNGTFSSVFSVSLKPSYSISTGDTLIFENVHTNTGNGYDKTTGLFTAPYQGLYSFVLTISINANGNWVRVKLKVEEKTVGMVFAGHQQWSSEQSSVSCVVHLTAGEVVKAVVDFISRGSSTSLAGYDNDSILTGYLIKAM